MSQDKRTKRETAPKDTTDSDETAEEEQAEDPGEDAPAPEAETEEAPEAAPDAAPDDAPDAVPDAVPDAADETADEPELPELVDPLEAAQTEAVELKDKLLRALAETENVRRRAQRDREDASKYSIANFAREMLKVADNLRRALDSIDEEARSGNETVESLAVGVEMTEREMLNDFERVGIKPIEALGQRYDHNLHEAMFDVEDTTRPVGTIIQVLERGYMLGERLLRPAKVGVAKGGPPATADAETAADETAAAPPPPQSTTAYDKRPEKVDPAGSKLDEKL
jgi:molecular chaperone GrpE